MIFPRLYITTAPHDRHGADSTLLSLLQLNRKVLHLRPSGFGAGHLTLTTDHAPFVPSISILLDVALCVNDFCVRYRLASLWFLFYSCS